MIFLLSLLCGVLGAWFVFRYAHLVGLVDNPSDRSSHDRPTPKGGGIGILLTFAIVCIWQVVEISFWVPAVLLAVLSFFGDRVELSPKLRLVAQFVAAGLFLSGFETLPLPGLFVGCGSLEKVVIASLVVSFLAVYIVGTANFFNFMDGINGIAGITGVVAFVLLGCYGLSTGRDAALVLLAFCMASACAGFLPFNMPKAHVFMGDVGSILLGFVFGCLVVIFSETIVDFMILVSFLFTFYMDELVSMQERIRKKQRLTKPHRTHLYQILANEAGVKHWKVSLGFGAVQLSVGLLVWWSLRYNLLMGIVVLALFVGGFVMVNNRVKRRYGIRKKMMA